MIDTKIKEAIKYFFRYLSYLRAYRKKQIVILVLTNASVVLTMVNPYISKLVVDKALLNKDLRKFIVLGIIGAAVFVSDGLINALVSYLKKDVRIKLSFDLNKKLFSHLQNLPLNYLHNKSTGEHIFNISYDIEKVVDFIVSVSQELFTIFPKFLYTMIIIFYLDWQMAVFALVLAPLLYLPAYYFSRKIRGTQEELLINYQNIFRSLQEVFSHIYLVKALGKHIKEKRKFLRLLIDNIRINRKNLKLEVFNEFSSGSVNRVMIGMITLFGGYQTIRGRITFGTLTAIMVYLTQLVLFQGSLAYLFQRIVFGAVSCKRLDEIFAEKPISVNKVNLRKIKLNQPVIQFDHVSFGYNNGEYVLKDISFIMKNGLIAVAGPSGCGKSTMVNLLLGLYGPVCGEILIDGCSLKDIELVSFKEQIGLALQEPFLWNDTIGNNIKYIKPEATEDEVISICRLAGVDDFVKNFHRGYNTVVGESACKISEGQKQKIAIARALINRPGMLILDEAMSSMDFYSEAKIMAHIRKCFKMSLVILVSHRLSSVMNCDLVYYLKSPGEIIIDSPQNLIANNAEFRKLFASGIKEESDKV